MSGYYHTQSNDHFSSFVRIILSIFKLAFNVSSNYLLMFERLLLQTKNDKVHGQVETMVDRLKIETFFTYLTKKYIGT